MTRYLLNKICDIDNKSTFWSFIKTITSVVGITKTITVPFGCLLRLVSVVGITKTLTVHWLFIKTIVIVWSV